MSESTQQDGQDSAGPPPLPPVTPSSGRKVWQYGLTRLEAGAIAALLLAAFFWRDNLVDLAGRIWGVDATRDWVSIAVASPTIHTRERLLNDRFEQVAWLEHKLAARDTEVPGSPQDDGPKTPHGSAAAAPDKPGAVAPALGVTSEHRDDISYGLRDPLQDFQVQNGYRDVLRAERARAMLDDRHDIDDNTLDLFSFDLTVMPRQHAAGYAAVEVIVTREHKDVSDTADGVVGARSRLDEQRVVDIFDTYIGWLEKVRDLQQSNLRSLTTALDANETPNGRTDYETTLRVIACAQYLAVIAQGNEQKPDAPKEESERLQQCRLALAGMTPHDARSLSMVMREAVDAMANIDRAAVQLKKIIQEAPVKAFLSGSRQVRDQKEPQDIVRDCSQINPGETIEWVPLSRGEAIYGTSVQYGLDPPPKASFACRNIPKNALWRALFVIIKSINEPFVVQYRNQKMPMVILDYTINHHEAYLYYPTSCLASLLIEDSLVQHVIAQPRNHGENLSNFFDIRVDDVSSGCSVDVSPKIRSLRDSRTGNSNPNGDCPNEEHGNLANYPLLCDLSKRLEGPGYGDSGLEKPATHAYGYSLAPRLRQNVRVAGAQADGFNIGNISASLNLSRKNNVDYQGVAPEVVGFERPIREAGERQVQGARFGWLLSPRPDKDARWSVPLEQAQLSAVVSLPSWWRTALVQICTRFVPTWAVGKLDDKEFWAKAKCRVEAVRLPGSAADISRRLGTDVLTTPYVEPWDVPPFIYAGNTGERADLLIRGERLWRNTVVTLGPQKANRIEVLPDMTGIVASFDCVRKPTSMPPPSEIPRPSPTGSSARGKPANTPPPLGSQSERVRFNVPVVVWTSEGHTRAQNVSVVAVASDKDFKPCPDERRRSPVGDTDTSPGKPLASASAPPASASPPGAPLPRPAASAAQ